MKHVALISCGKRKAAHPAPARDLYQGDLFRKSLRYAEEVLEADEMFILSAKHGLVALDEVIAPYEQTLNRMPAAEVRAWGRRVVDELRAETDLEQDRFTILAGANYRKHLTPALKHVDVPIEGLRFGEQLRFFKEALEDE